MSEFLDVTDLEPMRTVKQVWDKLQDLADMILDATVIFVPDPKPIGNDPSSRITR